MDDLNTKRRAKLSEQIEDRRNLSTKTNVKVGEKGFRIRQRRNEECGTSESKIERNLGASGSPTLLEGLKLKPFDTVEHRYNTCRPRVYRNVFSLLFHTDAKFAKLAKKFNKRRNKRNRQFSRANPFVSLNPVFFPLRDQQDSVRVFSSYKRNSSFSFLGDAD